MGIFKIAASLSLLVIIYQDFKERQVYWFLFPLLGLFLGLLNFSNSLEFHTFIYYITINLVLTTLVLGLLFIVVKVFFKKRFIDYSLGFGDILFFYTFAFGFPTITFIILFANSLLFSLVLFLFFKKVFKLKTVPLAGLMSLFLIIILAVSGFVEQPSLYTY